MATRALTAVAVVVTLASLSPGLIGQDATVQMIATDGEGAKYWSRWRGPSGQGVATGSGYPDTWSATQNVLWKL